MRFQWKWNLASSSSNRGFTLKTIYLIFSRPSKLTVEVLDSITPTAAAEGVEESGLMGDFGRSTSEVSSGMSV